MDNLGLLFRGINYRSYSSKLTSMVHRGDEGRSGSNEKSKEEENTGHGEDYFLEMGCWFGLWCLCLPSTPARRVSCNFDFSDVLLCTFRTETAYRRCRSF